MVMERTKISIIIPTLNAAGTLPSLLARLAVQEQHIDEILVVDSSSEDETARIAGNGGAIVTVINRMDFDHGGTRNLAARAASGNILVFMTQDALPVDCKTIGSLVACLHSCQTIVAYARQVPYSDATPAEQYLRLHSYPPQSALRSQEDIPVLGIGAFRNSNACAAYRRREFEILRGFPAPVVANEDMLYAARALAAGYRVAYSATSVVYHSHNLRKSDLFRRYFDIAASLESADGIKRTGKTHQEGARLLAGQIRFLIRKRQPWLISSALLEGFCRFCGFQLGLRHYRLPAPWKVSLGLNKTFWSNQVLQK